MLSDCFDCKYSLPMDAEEDKPLELYLCSSRASIFSGEVVAVKERLNNEVVGYKSDCRYFRGWKE
jgi:hypothetical protein